MPVIEVEHLHKRYGDNVAVDDGSFTVERGEIFGILGPNGAGKTTTVECLAGLRDADGGRLSVLGLDRRHDRAELRQRVGVQLQEGRLQDKLRVGELVELYAAFYRTPADPARLLATLGLAEHRKTAYRKLSGGQQQRLSTALALLGSPEPAVLDELTTGLDPQARRDTGDLIETVRDQSGTILLVTHFMEEAERLCDRIAVIDAGRVVAVDTPAGLVAGVDDGQVVRFRPSAPDPKYGEHSPPATVIAPMAVTILLAMPALTLFPNAMATYREKGLLKRLSASPVPPSRLLAAQLLVNLAAAVVVVLLVAGVGGLVPGIPLPANPGGFLLSIVLGALALFSVGLLVAALAPTGRAASGIGSAVFFPMPALGGVWAPKEQLPVFLQHVADVLPLGAMAAFAVVGAAIAARVFRWE